VPFGAGSRRKPAWTPSNYSAWKPGGFSTTTQPDFEELLRLLEEHHVEYMVVGGYAVAFHGYPRFTKDIDIFLKPRSSPSESLRSVSISSMKSMA
jgi:hypothetical protein